MYYFHNFLSDMERRHMISLAAPQVRRVLGQQSHASQSVLLTNM